MKAEDLYAIIRESGHYVVKATPETFRYLSGRRDIAPDYYKLAKHLTQHERKIKRG